MLKLRKTDGKIFAKKVIQFEIFEQLKFSSLGQIIKSKYIKNAIKVKRFSAAARLAAAAHAAAAEGGAGRSGGILFWAPATGGAAEECLL